MKIVRLPLWLLSSMLEVHRGTMTAEEFREVASSKGTELVGSPEEIEITVRELLAEISEKSGLSVDEISAQCKFVARPLAANRN